MRFCASSASLLGLKLLFTMSLFCLSHHLLTTTSPPHLHHHRSAAQGGSTKALKQVLKQHAGQTLSLLATPLRVLVQIETSGM